MNKHQETQELGQAKHEYAQTRPRAYTRERAHHDPFTHARTHTRTSGEKSGDGGAHVLQCTDRFPRLALHFKQAGQ